jgi:hypothetical protein
MRVINSVGDVFTHDPVAVQTSPPSSDHEMYVNLPLGSNLMVSERGQPPHR